MSVDSAYSNIVVASTLVDPIPVPIPTPIPSVSTAVRVLWAEMEAPTKPTPLTHISLARRDLWSVLRKKKGRW